MSHAAVWYWQQWKGYDTIISAPPEPFPSITAHCAVKDRFLWPYPNRLEFYFLIVTEIVFFERFSVCSK